MKKVLDYLEQLDFSKIEAKLYLTLLESGPMTVAELAQAINLNRTATYPYMTSLLEKGVIAEIMQGSRKKIAATEPEQLQYLIEKKQETLKTIEEKFPDIITTIKTSFITKKNEEKVNVKYYHGKNGVKTIYKEAFISTELRSYVNIAIMRNSLPENENLFIEALKNNKSIKLFEILEDSSIIKERAEFQLNIANHERYYYKLLPQGVKLSAADTLIYNSKVAVINVADKKNINGVVMENKEYYQNSKQLFDLMWRMLPEPHP